MEHTNIQPVSFSQRVVATPNTMVTVLDGEAVLLHLDSERYFGLDEVGTRIWQLLIQSDSIQAAYDLLLAEYDVAPERLRQDMTELIAQLLEQGMLETRNG